jgi:hypothetical protein
MRARSDRLELQSVYLAPRCLILSHLRMGKNTADRRPSSGGMPLSWLMATALEETGKPGGQLQMPSQHRSTICSRGVPTVARFLPVAGESRRPVLTG